MSESAEEYDGPEFEFWNHLWSWADSAARELEALDDSARQGLEFIGRSIIEARQKTVILPDSLAANLLAAYKFLLGNSWTRHAAEREIASIAIGRAEDALRRHLRPKPRILKRPRW